MNIQEKWKKPVPLEEFSFEKQALIRAGRLATAAHLVLNSTPEQLSESANELRETLEEYNHCILHSDDDWYLLEEETT
jgi:hypothetical protein